MQSEKDHERRAESTMTEFHTVRSDLPTKTNNTRTRPKAPPPLDYLVFSALASPAIAGCEIPCAISWQRCQREPRPSREWLSADRWTFTALRRHFAANLFRMQSLTHIFSKMPLQQARAMTPQLSKIATHPPACAPSRFPYAYLGFSGNSRADP